MVNGKICRGCCEYKLFVEYYKNSAMRDGYYNKCKKCMAKKSKAQYWAGKANRVRKAEPLGDYAPLFVRERARFRKKPINSSEVEACVMFWASFLCGNERVPVEVVGALKSYSISLREKGYVKSAMVGLGVNRDFITKTRAAKAAP